MTYQKVIYTKTKAAKKRYASRICAILEEMTRKKEGDRAHNSR